ncbi:hypothetical protein BJV78DRAFT_912090 [Lactifluus subvellereus]|nr:hypothetical protein BJV78DRAFT_912090 [Lactifluus subvellereus]
MHVHYPQRTTWWSGESGRGQYWGKTSSPTCFTVPQPLPSCVNVACVFTCYHALAKCDLKWGRIVSYWRPTSARSCSVLTSAASLHSCTRYYVFRGSNVPFLAVRLHSSTFPPFPASLASRLSQIADHDPTSTSTAAHPPVEKKLQFPLLPSGATRSLGPPRDARLRSGSEIDWLVCSRTVVILLHIITYFLCVFFLLMQPRVHPSLEPLPLSLSPPMSSASLSSAVPSLSSLIASPLRPSFPSLHLVRSSTISHSPFACNLPSMRKSPFPTAASPHSSVASSHVQHFFSCP